MHYHTNNKVTACMCCVYIPSVLITVACSTHECPTGSQCKVCDKTGSPYCEYSCDIDNGGCDHKRLCIEVDAPSCNSSDCCSSVHVTCDGM